jgi:hypothetical protein
MSVLFKSDVKPSGSFYRDFAVGYRVFVTDSLKVLGTGGAFTFIGQ